VINGRGCGRRSLSLSLPIALAITYFAVGCAREDAPRPEVVRPVKTMVVVAGDETHVRVFPGRVEGSKSVELAFQVSGVLISLLVKEGQSVAKNDLIAQLRQDEFQARVQSMQGQLDQARAGLSALRQGERPEERLRRETQVRAAEARLANARTDFERHARLVQRNAVPRADYERAETAYRVAQEDHRAALQILEQGTIARQEDIEGQEAQVRVLEGRLVEANLQLEDSTLRAPYDGAIARRFVDVGQNIRAKEPVVQFQDVEEVDLAVDVPETIMIADIRSADDMLDLVIGSDQTGRQLFLRDVASLQRGDQDPPRRLLRYDGKPAIGLGISTVQGGNVVTLGDGVRRSSRSSNLTSRSAWRSARSTSSPRRSPQPPASSSLI
jgi:membrane fusion protein, multidrug efflux system